MLIVVTKVDLNAPYKDVWHIFYVCYQFPKLGTDTYYTSLHVLVAEAWQEKYLETDFGTFQLFSADPDPKTFPTVFFCNHFFPAGDRKIFHWFQCFCSSVCSTVPLHRHPSVLHACFRTININNSSSLRSSSLPIPVLPITGTGYCQ